ncbi:MAG: ABC transporter permease [Hyphomonadaceae bacterium]|nr:ABC transporter permease [Hyphomonadaceae bacterium]
MNLFELSWRRVKAIFLKELVQMRRDRLTFAIMVMMPVMQLVLFGYAINTDPRHLPAAVELREDGPMTRSFLASLKASSYVDIVAVARNEEEGERLLRSGKASFLIVVPEGFERRLVRQERPQLLLAADASDPVAAGGVVSAVSEIARRAFAPDFEGPLSYLSASPAPYDIVVHRRYNPTGETAVNIVPGLLGVILTMTMVMITSIALTREIERGTMEMLLSTPVRPIEVMIGKTTPYVLVGAVQTIIVLCAAAFLFRIPFTGSWLAFLAGISAFIAANLMLGYLISTVARTQMQAMQLTFFVFLPSILLSGFMFPFRAMPAWAQALGEALPITHFLRVIREVMLKEAGLADVWGDLWPLLIILVALASLALARFRRTLD